MPTMGAGSWQPLATRSPMAAPQSPQLGTRPLVTPQSTPMMSSRSVNIRRQGLSVSVPPAGLSVSVPAAKPSNVIQPRTITQQPSASVVVKPATTTTLLSPRRVVEREVVQKLTVLGVEEDIAPTRAAFIRKEEPQDFWYVKRHVYQMKGAFTANSQRGSYLVSTDEIELDPTRILAAQLDKLVPSNGMGPGGMPPPMIKIPADEAPPAKWEQAGSMRVPGQNINLAQKPEVVFGEGQAVVVLLPYKPGD